MTPVVKTIGTSVWVYWDEVRVNLEFSRIDEHRETVTAEVGIRHVDPDGEVHWSRFNLLAQQARTNVVKSCELAAPGMTDWRVTIDVSCKLVVRHLRTGEPSVSLCSRKPLADWDGERWLVSGLIPRNMTTVLYADGGSGKSWLALALAVAGLQGRRLSDVWAVGGLDKVLYLDWESTQQDHEERLWALTNGREPIKEGSIRYRRLSRALTDHADQIAGEIDREGIDLVIADSLGAACGTEPETNDAALRTFTVLRSFKTTILVLAHVSKAHADQDGPRRPFGGVYVVNTARSTIEARKVDDEDKNQATITLYHRKTNVGRYAKPSALIFRWNQDGTVSIGGGKADMGAASIPQRILSVLSFLADDAKDGQQIADEIGESVENVTRNLRRMNGGQVVPINPDSTGRGNKVKWIRVDTRRTEE